MSTKYFIRIILVAEKTTMSTRRSKKVSPTENSTNRTKMC